LTALGDSAEWQGAVPGENRRW